MHVGSSNRRPTVGSMTGASALVSSRRPASKTTIATPLVSSYRARPSKGTHRSRRAGALLGLQNLVAGFDSLAACCIAPTRWTERPFHMRHEVGSIPSGATTIFRGVAKRYRARFGTERPEVRSLSPRRRCPCSSEGERLPYKQLVGGAIPSTGTNGAAKAVEVAGILFIRSVELRLL